MNYSSQLELYKALIPAFKVKQRLIKNNKNNITDSDIWKYLIETKWRSSYNLTISEIVNDIITLDEDLIIKYKEENNEKN